jgi:hypothetical protein
MHYVTSRKRLPCPLRGRTPLLDSAIQASPSNPALRILLRAFSGARASGSQTRRFTIPASLPSGRRRRGQRRFARRKKTAPADAGAGVLPGLSPSGRHRRFSCHRPSLSVFLSLGCAAAAPAHSYHAAADLWLLQPLNLLPLNLLPHRWRVIALRPQRRAAAYVLRPRGAWYSRPFECWTFNWFRPGPPPAVADSTGRLTCDPVLCCGLLP